MRRQIPGLHSRNQGTETGVSGVFLVRVDRAWYRRHPQKSFLELRFVCWSRNPQPIGLLLAGCIAQRERSGNSIGFFETLAMTSICCIEIK